jgi:MFS family permease
MVAGDLYGIVLGFGLASLGFGFTRPGFTAGASLAVPLSEQGGVAGLVTAANGLSFVAAPAIGMLLYAADPHWPFLAGAALLAGLLLWSRGRLA